MNKSIIETDIKIHDRIIALDVANVFMNKTKTIDMKHYYAIFPEKVKKVVGYEEKNEIYSSALKIFKS